MQARVSEKKPRTSGAGELLTLFQDADGQALRRLARDPCCPAHRRRWLLVVPACGDPAAAVQPAAVVVRGGPVQAGFVINIA